MHFISVSQWQEELQKLILKTRQSFGFFKYLGKGRIQGRISIQHFPRISISPSLFQQHSKVHNIIHYQNSAPFGWSVSGTNLSYAENSFWASTFVNHDSEIRLPLRDSTKSSCPILETREIIQVLRYGENSCGLKTKAFMWPQDAHCLLILLGTLYDSLPGRTVQALNE